MDDRSNNWGVVEQRCGNVLERNDKVCKKKGVSANFKKFVPFVVRGCSIVHYCRLLFTIVNYCQLYCVNYTVLTTVLTTVESIERYTGWPN